MVDQRYELVTSDSEVVGSHPSIHLYVFLNYCKTPPIWRSETSTLATFTLRRVHLVITR